MIVAEWLAGMLNRTFPWRNRTPVVLLTLFTLNSVPNTSITALPAYTANGCAFPALSIWRTLKKASPVIHTSRLSFVGFVLNRMDALAFSTTSELSGNQTVLIAAY